MIFIKKVYILIFVSVVMLMLGQCTTQKIVIEMADLKGTPEEYQKMITEQFNSGKKLYKKNCSRCHGIFTNGKENVPNFSDKQIDLYKKAMIQGDATNHAVAQKLTTEEFDMIIVFLTFRKR